MTTRIPIGAIRLLAGATAALAVAGTLVACSSSKTSGSGAAASGAQPAPASSGSSSSSSSGARAARGLRPAAQGTIAALAATSMEVQSPQSGQVTVAFGPKTAFTATTAAAKSVRGRRNMRRRHGCTQPSHPDQRRRAPRPRQRARHPGSRASPPRPSSITQPVNGTCNAGFGGLNGSGAPGPGGPPSGAFPSGTPSGGFGRGGFGDFCTSDRQGVRDYCFDDDRSRQHSNRFDHLHRDRRPQHHVHDDGAWDISIARGRQVRHRVRLDQFDRSRRRHPHRRQPGIVFGLHDSRLRPRAIRRRIQQYGWVRL